MEMQHWGVRPILFSLGGIDFPSYSFFALAGLLVGLTVIYRQAKRQQSMNEQMIHVVFAAFVGGVLGAKIPIWVANAELIITNLPNCYFLLSGRSLVGGIIGGTIAVWWVKRKYQINTRMGNALAPGIAIGISIGRIGCFLRGCCFGVATTLPWGIDFGDGVLRHPTQLYESAYTLAVFFALLYARRVVTQPGRLFDLFILLYFVFRFWIEFLRADPPVFIGLTVVQYVALAIVKYRGISLATSFLKSRQGYSQLRTR
jgi:phosphatidylglycerol---prolipoprotein diacylglyceryl transferase